jgi:hypothetical protein
MGFDGARLTPLLAQWDVSLEMLTARLTGVTDVEWLWAPSPGATAISPFTDGAWRSPRPAADAPRTRTIGWLAGHLGEMGVLRADYLVGSGRATPADLTWPSTAVEGTAFLREGLASWRQGLAGMTDADLDQVGRSQCPWGLDPQLPLLDIVWWMNRELVHHAAEIAFVRDLFASTKWLRGAPDARTG